jgi:hypothetical protein
MNSTTNTLHFQQVWLPHKKSDDAEIWREASTPPKKELIEVWHKSNDGFGRNNYLK